MVLVIVVVFVGVFLESHYVNYFASVNKRKVLHLGHNLNGLTAEKSGKDLVNWIGLRACVLCVCVSDVCDEG